MGGRHFLDGLGMVVGKDWKSVNSNPRPHRIVLGNRGCFGHSSICVLLSQGCALLNAESSTRGTLGKRQGSTSFKARACLFFDVGIMNQRKRHDNIAQFSLQEAAHLDEARALRAEVQ